MKAILQDFTIQKNQLEGSTQISLLPVHSIGKLEHLRVYSLSYLHDKELTFSWSSTDTDDDERTYHRKRESRQFVAVMNIVLELMSFQGYFKCHW